MSEALEANLASLGSARLLAKMVILLGGGGDAVASPINTAVPVISGTPNVGQTLTASTGTWTGSPTGFTYQWRRAGTNIAGATNNTYVVQNADVNQAVTVVVTATNAGGSTTAVSASVTGATGTTPLPRYWGTSNLTSLNNSQVLALTNDTGTSKSKTFTINGGGQYIYYIYPASFGALETLTLNNLNQLGAFTLTTQTVTPQNGSPATYNIYRSNNVQNGSGIVLNFA